MPLPDIPTGIESKANTLLQEVVNAVRDYQLTYVATRGRFWQGIKTSAPPKDGAKVAPDKTKKPTDQAESWSEITLPSSSEICFQVDTYDGPSGKGYVVVGELEVAGKVWRKTTNIGAESWRSHDWQGVGGG